MHAVLIVCLFSGLKAINYRESREKSHQNGDYLNLTMQASGPPKTASWNLMEDNVFGSHCLF